MYRNVLTQNVLYGIIRYRNERTPTEILPSVSVLTAKGKVPPMTATANSTTNGTPRFTGKHAREHYLEWLVEDARRRIDEAAMCPPLDPLDLYVTFTFDADAAYIQIARLAPKQLVAQAVSMAAYISEILGVSWSTEDILSRWTA